MSFPSQPASEGATPPAVSHSPYLHPLQSRRVRETSRANVDRDYATGRKLINQYEVIEEIGRGQHGKVKLAKNLENGENVAIKIVPRLSKTRRLGKLSARDPQQNINREIAILKKIRHPNVVALLEVIDDSELKKIYMVLEHVERGEIVWRKKGLPHIYNFERHRLEKEMRGEETGANEEEWHIQHDVPHATHEGSRTSSRVPSRNASAKSMSRAATPSLTDVHQAPSAPYADAQAIEDEEDLETPGPLRSNPSSSSALEGTMYGAYSEDALLRARSPSMADSIISHMSSLDFDHDHHYHDDFDYVPCFTMDSARSSFRDTVLGLEYLHYQGVVHRDIKPANLLWTRENRVKISDFGVSYFGRPIRESEPDETMSESEAHNFDDDRELSKTVGTPAFFAPELCYTDEKKDPPRVSEQIDVWSLGVTLYCLIFARIPFIADDEFAMFKKIATEEVFIPRRRLRPVHPLTDPDKAHIDRSGKQDPYRRDSDLVYEDIDESLVELLRAMLTKNPDKRIRLRDVKRHPWVMHGIDNMVGWLDDTDPSRRTSGRRIQVDERDIGRAVVPLTLLERARSTFKKAVGKVLPSRGDRSESSSRRRATSSAASSSGEGSHHSPGHYHREGRRKSLRGDDCFATVTQLPSSDHPLTQSVTASPCESPGAGAVESEPKEPSLWQSFKATTSQRSTQHAHARSVTDVELTLGSPLRPSRTVPGTPAAESPGQDLLDDAIKNGRSEFNSVQRSRSVDRPGLVFPSADKRATAMVGISTAVAPGNHSRPQTPTGLGHIAKDDEPPSASASPRASVGYSNLQPKSDTNIYEKRRFTVSERPSTSHRVEDDSVAPQYLPRVYNSSTPESFARAREQQFDHLRQVHSVENGWAIPAGQITDPSRVPCPPSPDRGLVSRGEIDSSARRDSRPDDDTTLDSQSHPSLPALMSGASSVSADMEGEFLSGPGVVSGHPGLMATTDSVTPPALAKEPDAFPLGHQENGVSYRNIGPGIIPLLDVNDPRNSPAPVEAPSYNDDDDDDSDEGVLTMASRKKKSPPPPKEVPSLGSSLGVIHPARRRDTNTSIASTETAKKVEIDSEQS